jgi:uncharacterized protein YdaU (DUF1376 family)
MSRNRAWMPLHIDDYLGDTDHLTAAEHGAYLLLIMKYWRDGGLPADEAMIRRFAKMTTEQWAESRAVIQAFFDADWKHKRIDAELAKADEVIEKRRAAAHARHSNSKQDADAVHVDSKSSDMRVPPSTCNQEEGLLTQSSGPSEDVSQETDEALRAWNEAAERFSLPKVQRLNATRRRSLIHRLADIGGIEGWRAMIEIIGKSPHLLGDNDRGWKVFFDWVLKSSNLTKVMEGNYVRAKTNRPNSIAAGFDDIEEAIRRRGFASVADGEEDTFGLPRLRQGAA